MDIKNRQLYGKVIATGIAEVPLLEGSLQKMAHEFLLWCMSQKIQKDSSGALQINLRVSDKPFESNKDDPMEDFKHMPAYAQMMAGVRPATEEEEAQIAAMALDPWRNEEGWKRLTYLHTSQSNFESSPEEYNRLWNYYESQYPQSLSAAKKKSR